MMKYKVLYTLYFDDGQRIFSCKVDSLEDALDLVRSLLITYEGFMIDISICVLYNGSWIRRFKIESDSDYIEDL